VAVNCWVNPAATDGLPGVTAIETKAAVLPVPLKETVCGELLTPSLKLSVALRVPVAAGVNVTVVVQLAPAESLLGLRGQFVV
jgi:hypothetical protein